jgi:hypothetical protein
MSKAQNVESVIDRIPHPELRDRMILLRGVYDSKGSAQRQELTCMSGRFDLVDCLMDYRTAVTIHGDDVLAHSNWEIDEKWLRQYGYVYILLPSSSQVNIQSIRYLIDQATLNISNRWRRERGEPEIRMSELVPQDT